MSKRNLSQLAKAVGCSNLDPIPPDQYLWMQKSGEPCLYRLWSWMIYQTMHWGRDSAFAVSADGDERHIEHAAADLGMDVSNVYRTWREGVLRGLWRNGTRAEGVRRLYLMGRVKPLEGEEEANAIVCTDNLPPHLEALPPYIKEQVMALPPERRAELSVEYGRHLRVRKDVQAEVIASARIVLDEDEDTLWQRFAIEKNRQQHATKAPPEVVKERQERLAAILPAIRQFVQTVQTVVQTEPNDLYNAEYNGESTNASLLALKTARSPQNSGSRHSSVAVGVPANSNPPSKRARSSYTAPKQPPDPEPQPRKIDSETHEALRTLAEQIEQMQKAYKHSDFGLAEFDPISKPGQEFLLRAVKKIGGPEHVLPYCLFVAGKFKGLDRHALGKLPARRPGTPSGPRGIGLLLDWADDYALKWRRENERSAGAGGGAL